MNGDSAKRDIKNHLLFEIATEVANRGLLLHMRPGDSYVLIPSSGWYLFRAQVKSSSHNRRVWGEVYADRAMEQELGMYISARVRGPANQSRLRWKWKPSILLPDPFERP